ncbi:MAG: hypothetical protein RPS47_05950 [Colwellia sp.]|jgi:hypothetical protein
MKNKAILLLCISAVYLYFNWDPSTSSIAKDMTVGSDIRYKDQIIISDWSSEVEVEAYVRRKDRHYDESMPVITFDMALTTGDFNDADRVKISHMGGGNYIFLKAEKGLIGSINFYHTIPSNSYVQKQLDNIELDSTIVLIGKISIDNILSSSAGGSVELMHGNHKFILVNEVIVQ